MGAGSSSPKPRVDTVPDTKKANAAAEENDSPPQVDTRLPYNFRDLYTLKNYWKTVRRNEKDCAKVMLAKYVCF